MAVSGTSLADANVWLALAVGSHVHHHAAQAWFEAQGDESTAFCRVTQLALLRHLTNSRILGDSVQTQAQAWGTYEALANDPRVIFLEEESGLEEAFRSLTLGAFPGHERWTDAYLAAFATAARAELVTFDQGFRGPAPLIVRVLG